LTSSIVAKEVIQNSGEASPSCPACGGDRVQFDLTGDGKCLSCGWRLRIDRSGEVRDALDWTTAGRRPRTEGAGVKIAAELDPLFEHAEMLLRESTAPLPMGITQALNKAWDERNRPYFDSPAEYASYAGQCWAGGKRPFPPRTVAELKAVNREYPDETRCHFRMPQYWLRENGLPDWFFDEIEPFGELWKERVLKTVEADPVFARALVVLFREAAR
jgi:hypothetical protein